MRLKDSAGQWVEDSAELQGAITFYFSDIFTANSGCVETIIENVPCCVSSDDNMELLTPYTADEIKCVVFSMKLDKPRA